MPTNVFANNNEVASKASDGKSVAAFPDVCFSPPAPPVGPIPLPYPNTVEVKDTDQGTAKVFIKDKMSGMAGDSCMTKSMGDDAATQNFNKGMITGALKGKCYFALWSMNVNMEGKGVPRHMDMVTHNHGSTPTNDPFGVQVSDTSNKTTIFQDPAGHLTGRFTKHTVQCGERVILNATGYLLNKQVVIFKIKRAGPFLDPETLECKSDGEHQYGTTTGTWEPAPNIRGGWCLEVESQDGAVKGVAPASEVCNLGYNILQKIVYSVNAGASNQYEISAKYTYQFQFDSQFNIETIKIIVNIKFNYMKGKSFACPDTVTTMDPSLISDVNLKKKAQFYSTMEYKDAKKKAQALLTAAENLFNNRYYLKRDNCFRGAGCSCKYNIIFKFNLVESGYDHLINLYPVAIRADAGNFGLINNGYPSDAVVWAHEMGHLVGYYDEYPEGGTFPRTSVCKSGTKDPVLPEPRSWVKNDPTSLMGNGAKTANPVVKKLYYEYFRNAAQYYSKNPFSLNSR